MTDLPTARRIRRAGHPGVFADTVTLGYDARFLRRKALVSAGGLRFLADLAETVSLDAGDAFELEDGRLIGVRATEEPLIEVRGDLARLAWHIGNRHTPCEIRADRLLIREDRVLADMLTGLGARLTRIVGAFTPEGGAYGHGRTMGHDHGHDHRHGGVHHHAAHVTDPDDDASGAEGDEPEVLR